jgi:hypothetical protein
MFPLVNRHSSASYSCADEDSVLTVGVFVRYWDSTLNIIGGSQFIFSFSPILAYIIDCSSQKSEYENALLVSVLMCFKILIYYFKYSEVFKLIIPLLLVVNFGIGFLAQKDRKLHRQFRVLFVDKQYIENLSLRFVSFESAPRDLLAQLQLRVEYSGWEY